MLHVFIKYIYSKIQIGTQEPFWKTEYVSQPESAKSEQGFLPFFKPRPKVNTKDNVGLVVIGGERVGEGGWEETKFMAQNVTLTRNVTTSEAICKIKS